MASSYAPTSRVALELVLDGDIDPSFAGMDTDDDPSYAETVKSGRLQSGRHPAVDDEVGACDISCTAAGQQQDQVGNLLRLSEQAGHGIFGGPIGDGIGLTARCPRDRRCDAITSEPEPGRNGAWADHVDSDPERTNLFAQGLAEA